MPKNLTDVDAFTDPVSVPTDGDARDAASVETPFQALANRTHNINQRISGASARVVTKADTTAGAELANADTTLGQSGTSKYWLIASHQVTGLTAKHRTYIAISGSDYTIAHTLNARWDAAASQWVADDDTRSAFIGRAGGAIATGYANAATVSGGWTDADWDVSNSFGFGVNEEGLLGLGGSLGAVNTPVANVLYSDNIPKAWGNISVASSTITPLSTYNVDEGSLVMNGSFEIVVPFRRNMADANFVVLPGAAFTGGETLRQSGAAVGSVNLGVADAAGSMVDLTANTRTIQFVVFGRQ